MTDVSDSAGARPPTVPVPKTPFLPSAAFAIRRMGRVEETSLTIYVFRDVLEELIFAANFRPALTTTGILTGGFYQGPAGPFVELRGFQDTQVVETTLQFTQRLRRDWGPLWRDNILSEAGLIPLGWFVSRPGCEAKPGPFELITHLSYFNLSHQLFAMLDPLEQVLGLYRQVDDGRIENVAFNVIESTDPAKEP